MTQVWYWEEGRSAGSEQSSKERFTIFTGSHSFPKGLLFGSPLPDASRQAGWPSPSRGVEMADTGASSGARIEGELMATKRLSPSLDTK
jgi:hypothetical protein